jgi:hypothetical protein
MKRAIVIALSVILALVVAAPTVLAQSENGVPPGVVNFSITLDKQNDTDTTLPASFGCDFPTRFDVTGKTKTIEQPDGSWIVTSPGFYVTVTNLVTLEALTFNATGSTHATPRPDGSGIVDYVITGRNVALDPFGVFLNKGRFTYSLLLDKPTPDGNLIKIVKPQQGKGQAIDVCALLS